MASYLSVISNDTLSHKALPGSPETLCGKLVVDTRSPREVPELNTITNGPLTCDLCETLTGGDSFIKENVASIHEAGRDCPHCDEGFDADGLACLECGGSGWLDEGDFDIENYSDLTGIDPEDLKGTKVASEERCDNCGESTGGVSKTVGNEQHCMTCVLSPTTPNTDYKQAGKDSPWGDDTVCASCSSEAERAQLIGYKEMANKAFGRDDERRGDSAWDSRQALLDTLKRRHQGTEEAAGCSDFYPTSVYSAKDPKPSEGECSDCGKVRVLGKDGKCGKCRTSKVATNWTRDGQPIEDGFTVITIDKEQASRTPFLDYTKVAVSERRECPDCLTSQWISKIAGCDSCGLLKCNTCMESVGPSQFMGMCKLCAGADSDLVYETEYQDPYIDRDPYLTQLMAEDEGETDPLFLPSTYE